MTETVDAAKPTMEWLRVDQLTPNPSNTNEQDERTFNATVASIEEEGWVQPCSSVVPIGGDMYEIVAGEHRWQAARVLDYETVPCFVLDAEKYDRDRRDWNMVKMNLIAGKQNPEKFARLYERMVKTYDAETLQALMGFTSTDAFEKVYKTTRDALPKDLQDALDDVKDEIRTIDDLSLVLNRLFREHGDTLPSDYMVFSWGGKEVFWVRASERLMKEMKAWGEDVGDSSLGSALEEAVLNARSDRTPDQKISPE